MDNIGIQSILSKPYARILIKDEGGNGNGYTATVLEMPGCIAEGYTAEEAMEELEATMIEWAEATVKNGQEIPQPLDINEYSGRLVLRMPKWLHKQAAMMAEAEGVSLNQWIVAAIGERVGAEGFVKKLRDKFPAFA